MKRNTEQAVLALANLDREDREWIVACLDEPERERLMQVLAQVEEGGAAPVAGVDPAPTRAASPSPSSPPASLSARQRLVAAPAREMFMLLSAEPDWMVAAVCGLHRWPWSVDLLRLLGPDRAQRITAMARVQAEPAAAVRDAMISALSARLLAGGLSLHITDGVGTEGPALTPDARRRGLFGRLANWLL